MKKILGIETSCDETAASVVIDGHKVSSNIVSSQINSHAFYGGVVPEIAAREHLKAINPVTKKALIDSNINIKDIDAVSVTQGPGLMPALLVGLNFARGISFNNKIPIIGINHFTAHIYSAFLNNNFELLSREETYPVLALVVSGGHTALVLIEKSQKVKIVGTTIDDAAGEAIDKGSKLLNLGYPGGPVIERTAKNGNPYKYNFPRSLTGKRGKPVKEANKFNFSFSGLKTSLLYQLNNLGDTNNIRNRELEDIVASYQYAIIDVLCIKTLKAATTYKANSIILCGGVAQNSLLREELYSRLDKNINFISTDKKFCGDNAAMIAGLGWHHYINNNVSDLALDAYSLLPNIDYVPFK